MSVSWHVVAALTTLAHNTETSASSVLHTRDGCELYDELNVMAERMREIAAALEVAG